MVLSFEALKRGLTFLDMKHKLVSQNSELAIGFTHIFGNGEDRAKNVHLELFQIKI